YISLLETDKAKNPSIKVLKKIADALEMQPIELIK
ncbi:MAG: helix-turn-helix domain-containing protein, partial [Sedimentibacter sp.]|nr:helix-turn-helix domain-containing protein [Sedimentibacter sp.]